MLLHLIGRRWAFERHEFVVMVLLVLLRLRGMRWRSERRCCVQEANMVVFAVVAFVAFERGAAFNRQMRLWNCADRLNYCCSGWQ